MLIAAFAGPAVGRVIDRHGGRGVLVLSNVVLAAGLVAACRCAWPGPAVRRLGILGIGMALGLYDAGFAALAALYGHERARPDHRHHAVRRFRLDRELAAVDVPQRSLGWRETVLVWAALNIVIGLPLNLLLPVPDRRRRRRAGMPARQIGWKPYREMFLLAFVFAAVWFVTGAMAAHLPRCSNAPARRRSQAVAAAALVGPAQVAARLAEFYFCAASIRWCRRALQPCCIRSAPSFLPLVGPASAAAFVLLYGAGNGLLTIARGTVPLAVFGPDGYGERTGCLARRRGRRRPSRRSCSACCSTSWERR